MATKVHDRLSGAIDACAIGLLSATLRDSVHKLDSSCIILYYIILCYVMLCYVIPQAA